MALIIGGARVELPGLVTTNHLDRPELALVAADWRKRMPTTVIRQIVLHTTKGIPGGDDRRPQRILPGLGAPAGAAERAARCWRSDGRGASAHLVVDFDGSVGQCADLATAVTFHAGGLNEASVGIEIMQGSGAELYTEQLAAVVVLVDEITRLPAPFCIQRQIPSAYKGRPRARLMATGADYVGILGHRDASENRGAGDPGDAIFELLEGNGYEVFDLDANEDRDAWARRQRSIGLVADGIPGPVTRAALEQRGAPRGMWIRRPGDPPPPFPPLVG